MCPLQSLLNLKLNCTYNLKVFIMFFCMLSCKCYLEQNYNYYMSIVIGNQHKHINLMTRFNTGNKTILLS